MQKSTLFILLVFSLNLIAQEKKIQFKNDFFYKLELLEMEVLGLKKNLHLSKYTTLKDCLQFFEFKMWSNSQDSLMMVDRLEEMARLNSENNKTFLLTYGTNGEGGLGFEKLDKKTKKYNYLFLTVSMDCSPGEIPKAIKIYNSISTSFLNLKYGSLWRLDLEKILIRRRFSKKGYFNPFPHEERNNTFPE